MKKVNDGGNAFPRCQQSGYIRQPNDPDVMFWERQANGMSLREWFAGMAMNAYFSGLLGNPDAFLPDLKAVQCVKVAVMIADALIKELEGKSHE